MLYDARLQFENAEYSYNEKLDALEDTLNSQYNSLKDTFDSYESKRKEVEDAKLTIEENRTKYMMGLISKKALDNSIFNLSKLENQLDSVIMSLNKQNMSLTQYSL